MRKDEDGTKFAHITVLERYVLTFARAQTNKHMHTWTHTGSLATAVGAGRRMQGLAVPACV